MCEELAPFIFLTWGGGPLSLFCVQVAFMDVAADSPQAGAPSAILQRPLFRVTAHENDGDTDFPGKDFWCLKVPMDYLYILEGWTNFPKMYSFCRLRLLLLNKMLI